MKTYILTLYSKHGEKSKYTLIDSKKFENCENRDVALERVKLLMMRQGLYLSNYKFTLASEKKAKKNLVVQ